MQHSSFSTAETKKIGERFAKAILKKYKAQSGRKGAVILALQGDLGTGKTTFVQGFARGLGIKRKPNSPTFVIMRRYPVSRAPFKNLYHLDLYRIKKSDVLEVLGLEEIVNDSKNIMLMEWPQNIRGSFVKRSALLTFRHGKKENERVIRSAIPLR